MQGVNKCGRGGGGGGGVLTLPMATVLKPLLSKNCGRKEGVRGEARRIIHVDVDAAGVRAAASPAAMIGGRRDRARKP